MFRRVQAAVPFARAIIHSQPQAFRVHHLVRRHQRRDLARPDRVDRVRQVVALWAQAEYAQVLRLVRNAPAVPSVPAALQVQVALPVRGSLLRVQDLARAVHLVHLVLVLLVLPPLAAVVQVAVAQVAVARPVLSESKAESRTKRERAKSYAARNSTTCRPLNWVASSFRVAMDLR